TVTVNPTPANASITGILYSTTGRIVTGITVGIQDLNGVFMGSSVTDQNGRYTISSLLPVTAVVYVANSTRTLVSAQVQLVNGQQVVQDLTFPEVATISLTANPKSLVGDGKATSLLTSTILDKVTHQPVAAVPVKFGAEAGTLSIATTTTNGSGVATSTLTAPAIQGIQSVNKTMEIVVRDLESGIFAEQVMTVTLMPATVEGIVTVSGQPVAGAQVTISEDLGPPIGLYTVTVTTGPDGKYSLVVPMGDRNYTLKIKAPIVVEGQSVTLEFEQKATVGALGNGEAVAAINQISGKLYVKGHVQQNIDNIFSSANTMVGRIFNDQGQEILDKPVLIEPDGRFKVEQLLPGTYRLLFQLTVNGQKMAGIWKTVTISADGQIEIETGLIDPYGIVRDFVTNAPIEGIDMQLYWADTQLNRDKGRVPDTIVQLPILADFAPNQNKNPQFTTAIGEYAWMVYADGDYYLKGTKTAYYNYDSREEGRTVPVAPGEDSYITNGIIHVGSSIVEYDFYMKPHTPLTDQIVLRSLSNTNTTINLGWNTVAGAVYYNVYGDGQYLGTVTSVTYSVYGLTSGQTYQYHVIAYNDLGPSNQSNVVSVTTAAAPMVLNVGISGVPEVGRTLTGSYTYQDVNNDPEGSTVFKWYRADDGSGTGRVPISGALGKTYVVQDEDIGKYISFEVTPVAASGTPSIGTSAQSVYVGPVADSLEGINDDIKNALKNLKVGFSDTDIWESVTKQVFLVKDGSNHTLVGWTSSHEAVIKIAEAANDYGSNEPRKFTANINRQPTDVSVILTATVSKANGTPLSRTFLLIVKSNAVLEQKVTEARNDSSVIVDGQEVQAQITRTTLSNGKQIDKLIVSPASMSELVQTNSQSGVLNVNFNDKPNNNLSERADELAVEIPVTALENVGGATSLQVSTPEGSVGISASVLSTIVDAGFDLFFRIVPIRDAAEQQTVVTQTKQDIAAMRAANNAVILDIPREIETNYTGFETEITLPLTYLTIPTDPTERQKFVESIRVLIQHTDGTKEVVGGSGNTPSEIVYANGRPVGFKFKITKFSTFTFFREADVAVAAPVLTLPQVEVQPTASEANPAAGTIQISLNNKAQYMDPQALTVLVGGKPVAIAKAELSDTNKLIIHLKEPVAPGYLIEVQYDAAKAQAQNQSLSLPTFNLKFNNGGIHMKYINGYPDGMFKPDNAVTRAEVAAMLARLLGKGDVKQPAGSYTDVSGSHWASSSIEVMKQTGIMQGYEAGEFKPEQRITRAEFAAVVLRFLNQSVRPSANYSFQDTAGHWARNEIESMKQQGYMIGEGALFHPDRNLSRNEAVTTLNRVLGRGPLTGDFDPSWPDVPKSNWGYGQVEEASRTHEFTRISDTEELMVRFIN
ncbi:S-layer homology domain-containing protein, partial [Paenibacillus koleovorans]|uniref:S-layer homology domain-containing protein n=1 Tax=Paenibacillus koleovorans TaxID=121608 RepID=UPI0015802BCB